MNRMRETGWAKRGGHRWCQPQQTPVVCRPPILQTLSLVSRKEVGTFPLMLAPFEIPEYWTNLVLDWYDPVLLGQG